MKILALVLITLLTSSTPQCLRLDLILIGDMSSSVEGHQKFVSNAFKGFIQKYELSDEGLRIGIITFNSDAKVICSLSSNKDTLISRSSRIANKLTDGNTYLEQALNSSLDEFAQNGRYGYKKMLVIVSDGDVNNESICLNMFKAVKTAGVKVCSVLILDSTPRPEFMKEISSDCYVATKYESLHDELQKLSICL